LQDRYKRLQRTETHGSFIFASVSVAHYLEVSMILPALPSFLCFLLLLRHELHPKGLIQYKAEKINSDIQRPFSVEYLGGYGLIWKALPPKGCLIVVQWASVSPLLFHFQ